MFQPFLSAVTLGIYLSRLDSEKCAAGDVLFVPSISRRNLSGNLSIFTRKIKISSLILSFHLLLQWATNYREPITIWCIIHVLKRIQMNRVDKSLRMFAMLNVKNNIYILHPLNPTYIFPWPQAANGIQLVKLKRLEWSIVHPFTSVCMVKYFPH